MVTNPGNYIDGHGLFFRVDPSGTRTWVQRIVIRDKPTGIDLCSASLVSLAEALEIALKNRKLTRVGGDPLRAKRKPQALLLLEDVACSVYEIHKPTWRDKPETARRVRQRISKPQKGFPAFLRLAMKHRCMLPDLACCHHIDDL